MSEHLVAFLWALIQITIACLCCLMAAISLRGRKPQLASALLAGGCCLSLLLLLASAFPSQVWSLTGVLHSWTRASVADDASSSFQGTPIDQVGDATLAANQNSVGDQSLDRPAHDSSPQSTSLELDTSANRNSPLAWLQIQLTAVDGQLRAVSDAAEEDERARQLVGPTLTVLIIMMLLATALWGIGWHHARRIATQCTPIVDPAINAELLRLQQQLRLTQTPQLFASSQIAVGATFGWRRPMIVLHQSYRQWTPQQITAVVAHELAHALRRDYAWVMMSSVIRLLLWFHPLIHLVVRRLRFEQELAADQIAASTLGARAYGRALAQLSLATQTKERLPSSVLAASQLCVLRRILMLKQGRLIPKAGKKLLPAVATILVTAAVIPLSGLRGQTPPERPGVQEPQPQNGGNDGDSTVEQVAAVDARGVAAHLTQPPFKLEGTTIYRQSRMNREQIGQATQWFASWVQSTALGRTLPDDCVLFGDAGMTLKWQDLKKSRGMMALNANITGAQNSRAGDLSRIFASPILSRYATLDETRIVNGRTATAYRLRYSKDAQPRGWVIDDEQGFVSAETIDELKVKLEQAPSEVHLPNVFEADVAEAAALVVFTDCDAWLAQYQEFISNSDKTGMEAGLSLLRGLESLGIFLMDDGVLSFKARFTNAESAQASLETINQLISMLAATLENDVNDEEAGGDDGRFLRDLAKVVVKRNEKELACGFDIRLFADPALAQLIHRPIRGWTTMGDYGTTPTDTGLVLQESGFIGALPNLVQQSFDAAAFRGHRIRIVADVESPQGAEASCGVAVWANDGRDEAVAFSSRSCDGESDLTSTVALAAESTESAGLQPLEQHRVSIALTVPADAQTLTIAAYCKRQKLHVQSFRVESLGPAATQDAAECPTYLAAFNLPGRPILDAPMNLGLKQASSEPSITRTAESKEAVQQK